MRLLNLVRVLFGLETIEVVKFRREAQEHQEEERLHKQLQAEARITYLKYPEKRFTQTEFATLSQGMSAVMLATCPIGTWFICKPQNPAILDIIVVGQVVKGDDLFCDQWGAGLAVPERGINRYRAIVV